MAAISGSGSSERPSTDTGMPDSKPTTTSVGSVAVARVMV